MKMVRLASVGDAGELERLNAEFNGKGKTTEEHSRSLYKQARGCHRCGRQRRTARRLRLRSAEKTFYDEYMPEITEVYVRPE